MAKRPNILKLATKISLESLTYTGITYTDPEYRILDPIVRDDMCRVMMHLRLETDRPVGEVAKRCKESEAFVQEQLDKLVAAGIVRSRKVDGVDCYDGVVDVRAGALALGRAGQAGHVRLADGTSLEVQDDTAAGPGLRAAYYEVTTFDYTAWATYETMLADFAARTPSVETTSASFGETLDTGADGARFHGAYAETDRFLLGCQEMNILVTLYHYNTSS